MSKPTTPANPMRDEPYGREVWAPRIILLLAIFVASGAGAGTQAVLSSQHYREMLVARERLGYTRGYVDALEQSERTLTVQRDMDYNITHACLTDDPEAVTCCWKVLP